MEAVSHERGTTLHINKTILAGNDDSILQFITLNFLSGW